MKKQRLLLLALLWPLFSLNLLAQSEAESASHELVFEHRKSGEVSPAVPLHSKLEYKVQHKFWLQRGELEQVLDDAVVVSRRGHTEQIQLDQLKSVAVVDRIMDRLWKALLIGFLAVAVGTMAFLVLFSAFVRPRPGTVDPGQVSLSMGQMLQVVLLKLSIVVSIFRARHYSLRRRWQARSRSLE